MTQSRYCHFLLSVCIGVTVTAAIKSCTDLLLELTTLSVLLAQKKSLLNGLYFLCLCTGGCVTLLFYRSSSFPPPSFSLLSQHPKPLLVDLSALMDPRLCTLARSGLLDRRLILPQAVVDAARRLAEDSSSPLAVKAKRALDQLIQLQALPQLHLSDYTLPLVTEEALALIAPSEDVQRITHHLMRIASQLQVDLLHSTEEMLSSLPPSQGVRLINIADFSQLFQPTIQRGELLKIKIQREGKEKMQGVGYLEDGTMVVVNGGGSFIGATITSKVISMKQTSSGRMLFCNLLEPQEREALYVMET